MDLHEVGLRQILDFKELGKMFRCFTVTTEYDIALYDMEGAELLASRRGKSVCTQTTDRTRCVEKIRYGAEKSYQLGEPYIYDTPCGLVMCSMPVVFERTLLGSIVCGPVILWEADDLAETDFRSRISALGADCETTCLSDVMQTTCERLTSAVKLLLILVNYLLKQAQEHLEQKMLFARQQEELHRVLAEQQDVMASVKQLEKKVDYHKYPTELEKEMIAYAQLGDRSAAVGILNRFLGEIFSYAGGNLDVIKSKLYEFCAFLTRSTVDAGVPLAEILPVVKKSATLTEANIEFADICVIVTDVLNSLIDAVYAQRNRKTASKHLTNAIAVIRESYMDDLSLGEVAKRVYVNSYYLSHLFREEMETTFSEYLTKVRLEHAKELLKEDYSIKAVADAVGFGDANHFTKIFKKQVGLTPIKYKQIWNVK